MIGIVFLMIAAPAPATEVKADPVPAAMESPSEVRLTGLLTVNENAGCSDSGSDALATEFQGGQAVFSQRIWLNSRESVIAGPVRVTREGKLIRAEVEIAVAPVEKGEVVSTCIRPVRLVLGVFSLPKDDYDVQFARKTAP